jgi:hypothetical protein
METRLGRGGRQTRQSFAGLVAIVAVVCSVLLLGAVEVQAGIFDYNDGLNSNSRILERVAMWSVKDSPVGSKDPYAKFECTAPPPPTIASQNKLNLIFIENQLFLFFNILESKTGFE